jgi:hypothetical protein
MARLETCFTPSLHDGQQVMIVGHLVQMAVTRSCHLTILRVLFIVSRAHTLFARPIIHDADVHRGLTCRAAPRLPAHAGGQTPDLPAMAPNIHGCRGAWARWILILPELHRVIFVNQMVFRPSV